jgi:hypothetical protein
MGKKELLLTARKEMALPKSKGLKIIEVLSKDHPKKGLINLDKLDWTVEESRRSQIRRSPRRKDHRISKSNLNVSSYIDGTVSNDFEDHIGLRMNTDTTNKNSVLEDESIPENLAVSQSQSVRRRSSRRRARGQAESEEDEEEESSGFGFIKQERANQPAVGQKKREETQAEEEESNPFGVVRRPAEAKPSAQVPEPQRPATQKRPALKTGESLSEEREHRGGIRNFVYGLDPEIYSEAVPERKDGRAERTDGGQGRTQVIGEVRQVLARMRRDASEVTEAIEGVGSADQYLQREAKSRTEAKSEWLRCLEEDQDYTKKFVNKVRAMRNDTLHLANFEKLVDNLLEARELASVEERVKVDGKNQKEGSVACNFKGGDTIKARINEKVEELRSKALSEYQRNQGYPGEEALGDLNELENRLRGEMKAIFAMEESLDPETAMLEAQKRINRLKRLDLLLKEVRQSNDERFEALKQNELIKKRKERARMEAGAAGGRGKTAVEDSALMGDYGESQEGLSDISWVELGSASQLRRG